MLYIHVFLAWYPSWAVTDHVLSGWHQITPDTGTCTYLVTSPASAPGLCSGPSIPRTHLMFSHTTTRNGQPCNIMMELLSHFLDSQENPSLPRLIDHELLVGEDSKRTVGFGWFAGAKQQLKATGDNSSPPDSCWCPQVIICIFSCVSQTWIYFSFPSECYCTFASS
jgi:hypothetical protein